MRPAARSAALRISLTRECAAMAGLQRPLHQLRVTGDDAEEVVEVVGDPPGEEAHRLHLLRLPALVLQAHLLADVHHDADDLGAAAGSAMTRTLSLTHTASPVAETIRYRNSWLRPSAMRLAAGLLGGDAVLRMEMAQPEIGLVGPGRDGIAEQRFRLIAHEGEAEGGGIRPPHHGADRLHEPPVALLDLDARLLRGVALRFPRRHPRLDTPQVADLPEDGEQRDDQGGDEGERHPQAGDLGRGALDLHDGEVQHRWSQDEHHGEHGAEPALPPVDGRPRVRQRLGEASVRRQPCDPEERQGPREVVEAGVIGAGAIGGIGHQPTEVEQREGRGEARVDGPRPFRGRRGPDRRRHDQEAPAGVDAADPLRVPLLVAGEPVTQPEEHVDVEGGHGQERGVHEQPVADVCPSVRTAEQGGHRRDGRHEEQEVPWGQDAGRLPRVHGQRPQHLRERSTTRRTGRGSPRTCAPRPRSARPRGRTPPRPGSPCRAA